MAKTIKFNLICDDKPVRTVEDLQNNFSVEDVLAYYHNKLLHRWLKVRGYEEELEKVNAITEDRPIEIVKKLIQIFHVESDDRKMEEGVYILEYLEEKKERARVYEKENYETKLVLSDYEAGYRRLIAGILQNPDDAAKIEANISEIVSDYAWILELNHRELFYELHSKEMFLAIMCLLMNEQSRKYYLPIETKDEDGTISCDTEFDEDKEAVFDMICGMIQTTPFITKLKESGNLKAFAGVTDGYWKDLEPKGKTYMVISMENGDYIRSAGDSRGDLSSTDIKEKFVILDGIDYKSNSATHQLLYMEV